MLKVGVLVSGGGSNLQAILTGIETGQIPQTEVVGIVSNKKDAYALERGKKRGINSIYMNPKEYESVEAYEQALVHYFQERNTDLIVLAGFMRVLGDTFVNAFPNRIMNIHPSLIPSFCGKGYYGIKVHEAALAYGVKVTGATVHFVDLGTDTGPIILQKVVPILEEDTPETLQKRVLEQGEWEVYPEAIALYAQGRIKIEGRKVRVRGGKS
ncbi:MAG: phosphoribosylglycinamide formyltransferase [Epulopiscium sp.]|nr:phosphoribosylglycinamide formyltransferase [Candidatus Epulonipiscium sp.]